ncbi:MAG: LPS-assembly protein LptD, partial [Bacteroidetes bacterium]
MNDKKSEPMNFRFLLVFFCFVFWGNHYLFAQDSKKNVSQDTLKIDQDSIGKADEIEEIINYSAKDSIRFNVVKQIIYLYGSAKIKFGLTELAANYIEIDQFKNQVMAKGTMDTTTKKMIGDPVFTDKGTTYNAKVINYNFKTKKGIISGTSTKQGEGNIVSETVKRDLNGHLYARYNLYTTCDLPHPHFGIRSQKMKIIPGKLTASGPFFLEMGGVPTPLGFFFGLFPQPGGKASGFLMPQYGETRERGFFLANGGIYLAISNYVDARITGEMYSKGGYGFNIISNYKDRYKYDGNINFRYNVRENEVAGSVEKAIGKDFSFAWSHTPKGRGKGKFSANVNIATSNFNQRNAPDARSYLSSSLNSNIQYNTSFLGGKITLGTSLRHEQNIITKVASVLPSAELRITRITPFAKLSDKKNLLTSLNMSYTMSTSATITNVRQGTASFPFTVVGLSNVRDTIGFNLANINQLIENTRTGMTHNIPISTSARVLKFFDLSLSFNYKEVWYPENYSYQYLGRDGIIKTADGRDSTIRIQKDTVQVQKNKAFSRFNDYSVSASLTTRIYGTYYPKIGRIQAIRHIINPTISLSYRPDFGKSSYGFYENVQSKEFISAGGQYAPPQFVNTSYFQGIYGQPSTGESASMNIGITNTLEAKMKSKYDSIKKPEKITLLNFSLNTGYNFLAKEYKLSNISVSGNTTVGKFN